jgi:hypothetical protein
LPVYLQSPDRNKRWAHLCCAMSFFGRVNIFCLHLLLAVLGLGKNEDNIFCRGAVYRNEVVKVSFNKILQIW